MDDSSPPARAFFTPTEASFVEAMVDVLCPADELSPRGTECGLAAFIDQQLAGGFGRGERLYRRGPWRRGKPEHGYQLPLTPAEFFRAGLAEAEAACLRLHGVRFAELAAGDADRFLAGMSAEKRGGDASSTSVGAVDLAQWFNELAYPLFVEACFADPMYGGNKDKVFWRMIGFPGVPANYAADVVKYRGAPHPAARMPKSMGDLERPSG